MKNVFSKFFQGLIAILIVIILIAFAIIAVPFDYIKYKRSAYYKKTRKKYELFAASGINFELYNIIIKFNLPIKYIPHPKETYLDMGIFIKDKTVIVPSGCSFEFDAETGIWKYIEEDDGNESVITVDGFIADEIKEINGIFGENTCEDVIILLDGDCIDNADKAKDDPRFIVYKDNMAEVLIKLCKE